MAASRNIIIAGAGIGGLTASLAIAQTGFRVTLLEQAERLQETGAGIQLSPNATRQLIALGLEARLRKDISAPAAVDIRSSGGRKLTRIPLGEFAEQRYGAPYWSVHRADLQAALVEAVQASPDIVLKLGARVEDFVTHAHGITVACRQGGITADETGIALIGADGLWSTLRTRLGNIERPVFRHRVAWRAMVPAEDVSAEFRYPAVHLWLGPDAHLVHYAVKAGTLINIVAIVRDRWGEPGWSAPGERDELLARYSRWRWAEEARALLALPGRWQKWALYDVEPLARWGDGPVTLLGDAAHPMLPFLAQGGAMAIEDAAVLAAALAAQPDNPTTAMRLYETDRRRRTAKVQHAARRNSGIYHLGAGEAVARNLVLRLLGGQRLLRRYDWLYDWKPAPPT